MAEIRLDRSQVEAGRLLADRLDAHGFEPEALFWSVSCGEDGEPELSIHSSALPELGSLAMHATLFEAADRGLLPHGLDPWRIVLYGPGQMFFEAVRRLAGETAFGTAVVEMDPPAPARLLLDAPPPTRFHGAAHLLRREWIYRLETPAGSVAAQRQGWAGFAASVGRVAA